MRKVLKYHFISSSLKFILATSIIFIATSCNQVKYVPEGKYLLKENQIIISNDTIVGVNLVNRTGVSSDDLTPIIKQKPNRKMIIGKFYLWLYNRTNQNRIDKKIVKNKEKAIQKNEKIESKNEKKLTKNPSYRPKELVERKKTFGEKLRTAGEAPVILDSIKIQKTEQQMSLYLIKKGYFNNKVKSEIVLLDQNSNKKKNKQKANVIYRVTPNKPHKIQTYTWDIRDQKISNVLNALQKDSLIKVGANFDTDLMEQERVRITKHLSENGFYYFNKEFIFFRVDSTLGDHKLSISLGIQNFKYKDFAKDTMLDKPHKAYKIGIIEIYPDFEIKDDEYTTYKTLNIDGIEIKHKYEMKLKPTLLASSVLFDEGELYQKTKEEGTYKKFMSLGNYRTVSMKYDTIQGDLRVRIYLEPSKSQTFNIAADGTHTNGLFGVEGSMTYTHSNLFGGAERLRISMSGGLEMQRLLFASDSAATFGSEVSTVSGIANTFNTAEFGPKLSLTLPKLLFIQSPLEKLLKSKLSSPQTEISASVNYQRRPDFKRGIEEFSFGWIYHETAPITIRFYPLIVSAIAIEKSQEFENRINELNDRFLAASYQDHIIAGGKASFIYNGQNDRKVKNTFYFQSTLETAGNLLRGAYNLLDRPYDNDSLQSYNLFNIRFAQFVKISGDLRYYQPVFQKSKLVYRVAGGIGVPLSNLNEAIPFEKSFFSGGANGMRAWKARTLGPGSYTDPNFRFDKIGDIQLEANIELRFPMISWVEGALFVDAGNIWTINEDPVRTGGKFDRNEFVSEIAIGSGLGLRFDLDFFMIRLDFALPIRNPAITKGERWIWDAPNNEERRPYYRPQFNLGIGYPF